MTVKLCFVTTLIAVMAITACSKYEDPPPAGPIEGLDSPYCNDSRAVNFNWGFPGKPDNSVCIYPVDPFLGSWQFNDSIFLPDNSLQGVEIRQLTFNNLQDTTRTKMSVSGWCTGSNLFITANKYSRADVDSLPEGVAGQVLCSSNDTLTGYFYKTSIETDTMSVQIQVIGESGTTLHKGTAIRQ